MADDFRQTDEHNPRGYFEFRNAMSLGEKGESTDWVAEARGKAVKVIAYRLKHLPPEFDYRVIFMRRKIAEVLASCGKMGILRRNSALTEREQIMAFKTEYAVYEAELTRKSNMAALFVQYNELLDDPPGQISRVCGFLGVPLNAATMAAAIDPALYRNRF